MDKKIKKLKTDYENACNNYLDYFCKKQGLENNGWINNMVGEVAQCSDMFFIFRDIIIDINTQQPKGFILQWQEENMKNIDSTITYDNYIKDARYSHLKNKKNNTTQNE